MSEVRQRVLLFRSPSATTGPDSDRLEFGELAIGYKAGHEQLYIKNSSGDVVSMISKAVPESFRKAVGVKVSGNTEYYYQSNIPYLSAETIMADALDDVAARASYITPTIKTNFDVRMYEHLTEEGTIVSTPIFTYNINTPVDYVAVSKVIGDEETAIYSGNAQAMSGQITVNNIEEEYVLEFVPSDVPNVIIQETIHAYVVCTTTSSAETMSAGLVTPLQIMLTTEDHIKCNVNTSYGDYMWFLIPSTVSIDEITSFNIDVTLYEPDVYDVIEAGIGELICIRSLKPLIDNNWKIKVFLNEVKEPKKTIVTISKAVSDYVRSNLSARALLSGHTVASEARIGEI